MGNQSIWIHKIGTDNLQSLEYLNEGLLSQKKKKEYLNENTIVEGLRFLEFEQSSHVRKNGKTRKSKNTLNRRSSCSNVRIPQAQNLKVDTKCITWICITQNSRLRCLKCKVSRPSHTIRNQIDTQINDGLST